MAIFELFKYLIQIFVQTSPLARREAPVEGRRPDGEGANLDRRLVPYHGKCALGNPISYRVYLFIYIYLYIYIYIYIYMMVHGPFFDGVRRLGTG